MKNIVLFSAAGTSSGNNNALVTYTCTSKMAVKGIVIGIIMNAAAVQYTQVELSFNSTCQASTNDPSGIVAVASLGMEIAAVYKSTNSLSPGGFTLNPGDKLYVHAANSAALTANIVRVTITVD